MKTKNRTAFPQDEKWKKRMKNNKGQIKRAEKANYSKEYKVFIRKNIWNKVLIIAIQIGLLVFLVALWEILAKTGSIDAFITSSPSRIWDTIKMLIDDGTLFFHIGVTLYEAVIGFLIATVAGTLIAIVLWWNETIRKVLDPYIVVLNSLPKIALGPIIIV